MYRAITVTVTYCLVIMLIYKCKCLLTANNSTQTENETMIPLNMVDVTTDAVLKDEKFIISNHQQLICGSSAFQETQRGLEKHSLMLICPIMCPSQHAYTGGIMREAGSTSHGEDLERYLSSELAMYVKLYKLKFKGHLYESQ